MGDFLQVQKLVQWELLQLGSMVDLHTLLKSKFLCLALKSVLQKNKKCRRCMNWTPDNKNIEKSIGGGVLACKYFVNTMSIFRLNGQVTRHLAVGSHPNLGVK